MSEHRSEGKLRPEMLLRQELLQWRAGALLAGIAVAVGVVQALAWSRIAPGEPYYVSTSGQYGGLPTGSYHEFADVAIFVLIGTVVGVSGATAAWRWRSTRGTAIALAVAGANLLGALTAYLLAPVFAPGVDPSSVGTIAAQTVVTAPPTVALLAIVAQPAAAIAVYTFLAAWNGRPDLERQQLRSAHMPEDGR